MTNPLRCEITPLQIRLLQGNKRLNSIERQPTLSLEATLLELLQPFSCKLPWLLSIKFQLDASLVHHLVTPWQVGISAPEELRNYSIMLAKKDFPQLMGKSLMIGFEDCAYGHNALTLVLEEELWQTLRQVTQCLTLRFLGVTTPLHSLLETWHGALPSEGIFALPGEQNSTFAYRCAGEWQQIYRMTLPELNAEQQLVLVGRLIGMHDSPCYIWEPEQGRIILNRPGSPGD